MSFYKYFFKQNAAFSFFFLAKRRNFAAERFTKFAIQVNSLWKH